MDITLTLEELQQQALHQHYYLSFIQDERAWYENMLQAQRREQTAEKTLLEARLAENQQRFDTSHQTCQELEQNSKADRKLTKYAVLTGT